jgi:hypothetical protein
VSTSETSLLRFLAVLAVLAVPRTSGISQPSAYTSQLGSELESRLRGGFALATSGDEEQRQSVPTALDQRHSAMYVKMLTCETKAISSRSGLLRPLKSLMPPRSLQDRCGDPG